MSFGEKASTNQLPVAVFRVELNSSFTNTFPPGRNRTQIDIGEASAFRPDSGIKDTDNDIRSVIGLGPQPALVSESEELRGASGMKVTAAVFEDGEDGRVLAEKGSVVWSDGSGEAVENGVVDVEDLEGISEF